MISQLLADLPSIGPLPRMISFVLSGRRTLSEHLPAETIDVPSSIVQHSNLLRKVIVEQGLTYPSTWRFTLPNVDPIGFRMYIEWLESDHIVFSNAGSTVSAAGLPLRDTFDLVFAHIAGTQLEEPHFQDYVIDTMTESLDVSQTPDLKVLEVVFLENGASNMLKQFIVDKMFAVERKMLGMMRGRVEDPEEQQQQTGCKYHVHVAGECYRAHLRDSSGDRAKLSHVSHHKSHSVTHSHHSNRPSSTPFSNPESNSPTPTIYDLERYNMTGDLYFGSAEWSREVHGLQRMNTTPELHTNKPLPNIPPLTPGSSPTPPLSPRSFPRSTPPSRDGSQIVSDGTQQLVFEYLSRLPPIDAKVRPRAESEPDLHRAAIPGLVLECLARFKNSYSDGESSGTSSSTRVSSPYPAFDRDCLPILREPSATPSSGNSSPNPTSEDTCPLTLLEQSALPATPYSTFDRGPLPTLLEQSSSPIPSSPTSERTFSPLPTENIQLQTPTAFLVPGPERRVHWEKSYDTLPKPWVEAEAQIAEAPDYTLDNHSQPEHTAYHYQPPLPVSRADSTLIKRKTAPPRGTDWLKQYDKINDMMGDAPTVVAKRSRRSRFKELLRSESRLGSVKLKGQ